MATLIGALVAVIAGLGLAAGGSLALVSTSDPDTTDQVQAKIKEAYNPQSNPLTIYGKR
ncbi:MAG: hypothetical protein ABW224_03395 [Kibdelosporangium sp.]